VSVRLLTGDCRVILPTLAADSVHCVVTSPPYWGLRDYGVAGQLGLEATPEEYVATMVAVFREVRRVLRDDGTLWLNMGDNYATGDFTRQGNPRNVPQLPNDWEGTALGNRGRAGHARAIKHDLGALKPKDLVGMPWRLAFALQADGWFLRADIIWAKPNPMPESVTDRPTKAHEYVFLLSKAARYFYDADAVREAPTWSPPTGTKNGHQRGGFVGGGINDGRTRIALAGGVGCPEGGRNLRSVWTIASEPYPEAHFATFPPALARRCILAGTSAKGCCRACGAPWARVVDRLVPHDPGRSLTAQHVIHAAMLSARAASTGARRLGQAYQDQLDANPPQTIGWTPACTCDAGQPIPCTVLDPFAGSGTVGEVAEQNGRHSILIELSPAYVRLAEARTAQLGLFAQSARAERAKASALDDTQG
jgi:DNA modification methylase